MAAAPTAKVEINFSGSTWTDVTAYWDAKRPITMTGGRSDTDERVQPGRLSGLVLNNTDGRFTVGNASGAYSPNVVSGRKVRVSIKDPASSTYYPRFTGRIDGWPLHWEDNGNTCWVTISATDMLGDWNRPLPSGDPALASLLQFGTYQVAAENSRTCYGYWPMTAPGEDGHLYSDTGIALVNQGAAPADFSEAGPPSDPRPLLKFPNDSSAALYVSGDLPLGAAWGVSAWVKIVTPVPSGTSYFRPIEVTAVGPGDRVCVHITSTNVYAATISGGGTFTDRVTGGFNLNDGAWHYVSLIVYDSSGTWTLNLTVDGVTTLSPYSGTDSSLLARTTYPRTLTVGNTSGTTAVAAVGHVAIWDVPATSYDWGFGMREKTVSARLDDIAAAISGDPRDPLTLPAIGTVGTAQVTMGRSGKLPGNGLDALAHICDTDGGAIWCNGSGDLTYTGYRPSRTIALALTAEEVGAALAPAYDPTIVSQATVSNTIIDTPGFWSSYATLTTRATADTGQQPPTAVALDVAAVTTNVGYPATRAAELLRSPSLGISQLPLDVMPLSDANQLAVLGIDMWDLIGITGLPTAGGFDTKWLGRVEGWSETVGIDVWAVTFNTSFAGNSLGDATHGLILGSNRLG